MQDVLRRVEFRPDEAIVVAKRGKGRLTELERLLLVGVGCEDGLVLLVGRRWKGWLVLLVGLKGRLIVLDLLGGVAVRGRSYGCKRKIGLLLLSTFLSYTQLQLYAHEAQRSI